MRESSCADCSNSAALRSNSVLIKLTSNFDSVKVYWLNCSPFIISPKNSAMSGSTITYIADGSEISFDKLARETSRFRSHSDLSATTADLSFLATVRRACSSLKRDMRDTASERVHPIADATPRVKKFLPRGND